MLYVWNVAITVKFFLTLYDGKMSEEKNDVAPKKWLHQGNGGISNSKQSFYSFVPRWVSRPTAPS